MWAGLGGLVARMGKGGSAMRAPCFGLNHARLGKLLHWPSQLSIMRRAHLQQWQYERAKMELIESRLIGTIDFPQTPILMYHLPQKV
jgi:hypothetical protein